MKASDSRGERGENLTVRVAAKILRYLDGHPDAADTADGVFEWWLLKQSMDEEKEVVERALRALVARGLVRAVHSADSRTHYHLNVDRLEECREFIREARNEI